MSPYTELHDISACWLPLAEKNLHVWRKGHVLADESRELYLLVKGRIRLTVTSADGEEMALWDLCDKTIFNETPAFAVLRSAPNGAPDGGSACVLHGAPDCTGRSAYSFSHICVNDCLVGHMALEDVLAYGRRDPELLLNLCGSFALKLSLLAHRAACEHLDTPRKRVFRFLAARIIPGAVPPVIRKDLSMQNMANLIGLHRVSLYKELNWARTQKILSFERSDPVICILDMERFCAEAGLAGQLAHRRGGETPQV